ncbi:hypothetical protein QYE76_011238 [Lolium multiflorum]|uniref:Ribonuclease H n=1 Tax=Lolium multiflorum TaxID=4521 RepID=A0AAD8TWK1_LOLMU|nr:hypothetical protein QYE76_011238 [Lolium multiflorum]
MPRWFIPAYFKKTQASKLGDAQGIPFFIDNLSGSSLAPVFGVAPHYTPPPKTFTCFLAPTGSITLVSYYTHHTFHLGFPTDVYFARIYYMRDSQLQDGSSTRTKAVRYLESFMLMNKEKNTILLPVFPDNDKYCTLVILCPKWSLAQYFDSSNTTTKKDYRRIRGVLDEAILGYSKNGGTFDKKGEFVRPDTKKLGFKHVIDFPCIKQPAGSIKEAFYVLHHLKGFVEDAEMMSLPPSKRDPIKMSGEINDDDLREDFHRIQMTYYVVFEGRVPGVYEEWEDCKKQVHKFSGNCYKGYPTRHEAVAKWRNYQSNKSKMKMKTFVVLSVLLTIVAAVLYFILV